MRKQLQITTAIILCIGLMACSRVKPSFSGVLVSNWASDDKGSIEAKGRGNVWYNPFTQDLYIFPLHIQRVVYEGDQAIKVTSKDNAEVTLSVGHAYQFVEMKVPQIFSKYRTDPEALATGVIRDAVRNSFVKAAGQYNVMDILGSSLSAMNTAATLALREMLIPEGVKTDQLYVIGRPAVAANIEASITNTLAMIQQANREEEKVRSSKAIADQAIAEARGVADSILIRAKAEADAAELLQKQLTPLVLQNHAISKWDGKMPQVSGGGAVPFIGINPATAGR